jgi:hypothetical protein
VQRMMETVLERRGLAVWGEEGVLILLKEGATLHLAKEYADYAYGQGPNYASVVSEPLAAGHYHEGYGLAPYELGDLRMSTQEEVDLAAWARRAAP